MTTEITNKVAASGILTFNLEEYYAEGERAEIDIKNQLYEGLILKEKDFRDFVKNNNWEFYKSKFVAVFCSNDAIVPTWAYMLLTTKLQPFARKVVFGNLEALESAMYFEALSNVNIEEYRDQRVVIKGCSNKPVPVSAYVEITEKLTPVVKSIMYGEPCSTVPLYKKTKE